VCSEVDYYQTLTTTDNRKENKMTYTVKKRDKSAKWFSESPLLDDCGHKHRSFDMAVKCRERIYRENPNQSGHTWQVEEN